MKVVELEKILKALASRRRLGIIKYLQGEGKGNVQDIAAAINLSYRSTSKHLGVLKSRGIIESEYQGKENYYRLSVPLHPMVRFIIRQLSGLDIRRRPKLI